MSVQRPPYVIMSPDGNWVWNGTRWVGRTRPRVWTTFLRWTIGIVAALLGLAIGVVGGAGVLLAQTPGDYTRSGTVASVVSSQDGFGNAYYCVHLQGDDGHFQVFTGDYSPPLVGLQATVGQHVALTVDRNDYENRGAAFGPCDVSVLAITTPDDVVHRTADSRTPLWYAAPRQFWLGGLLLGVLLVAAGLIPNVAWQLADRR